MAGTFQFDSRIPIETRRYVNSLAKAVSNLPRSTDPFTLGYWSSVGAGLAENLMGSAFDDNEISYCSNRCSAALTDLNHLEFERLVSAARNNGDDFELGQFVGVFWVALHFGQAESNHPIVEDLLGGSKGDQFETSALLMAEIMKQGKSCSLVRQVSASRNV